MDGVHSHAASSVSSVFSALNTSVFSSRPGLHPV